MFVAITLPTFDGRDERYAYVVVCLSVMAVYGWLVKMMRYRLR